ncbi:MAG: glycosyltransferase family 8 protein [Clostridia bacterium]|nr:glycosyltransferase family 8 protein [Clostridia bacterium]
MKLKNKKEIPVFFASDKNYVPYLTIAIKSLANKISNKYMYKIYILTNDLKDEDISEIKQCEKTNLKVDIVDVNEKIESIKNKVALRDYYSVSIYFRLFIPSMFPQYDKAIYLDSDIVLNDDIANLYNVDIGLNYLGAVLDEVVYSNKDFVYYTREALDVTEKQYFNSGVLIMNLKKFRKNNIEDDFYKWVNSYNFGAVAPDQDYLNVTCKNSVKYLKPGWNKMPMGKCLEDKDLYLIHYNMFMKPWKYENLMFEEYFWDIAKTTSFYDKIKQTQASYTQEQKDADRIGGENLIKLALNIANSDNNYKTIVLKKGKTHNAVSTKELEEDILDDLLSMVSLPCAIKTNHRR